MLKNYVLSDDALRAIACKLITELAGSFNNMSKMTGVKSFMPLDADYPGVGGVGGVAFAISGRLCKNKATYVRIFAFEDGHREIYFFKKSSTYQRHINPYKYIGAYYAATPADLPRVWYEATACATQMPRVFNASRLKFEPGKILMTPGVKANFTDDFVHKCLNRHLAGDWGDVCPDDATANDEALQYANRIISAYNSNGSKLYIITEADRSATTCLLPSEY